ncbi:MAG: DNRLRE domain-containing protein [bacterium]
MKHAVSIKTIGIIVSIITILFFIVSPLSAQSHSYGVVSGSLDGELKSKGSSYGSYELGNKSFNRGALGGGNRGFEWVLNSNKSPGKRGAYGAIDAEPDIGGSSKGNTFTTTSLGDTIRVGQTFTANYEIFKGFLSFDTSGIPYDATITSATLSFYGKAKHIDPGEENFNIQVYESVWTEPLWNPDWGATSGTIRGSLSTNDFAINQKNTITISPLNANYLVTKGGTTRIALVSSRTISAQQPSGNEYVEIYSSNAVDPNVRPKLDLTYNGDAPNIRPALTWTGEQYYKMNGVYPEEIWVGENNLIFRVQYTHPLGVAPLLTQLWIDLNSDGDFYDPGEKLNMRETDQLDKDYSNGKNYYANVTLNSDGITEIRYRFVFTDDNQIEAIGTPAQVASLVPLQAEEKNVCFINTAEKTRSFSSLIRFLKKTPLIGSICSSVACQKLMLSFPF